MAGRGVSLSLDQWTEIMRNMPNAGQAAAPAPPIDFARLCRDFTSLGGVPFLGNEGIVGVQDWLKSCDQIFRRLDVTDLQKVQIASNFLREGPMDWFEIMAHEVVKEDMTWDNFKERFELKFVPEAQKAILAQ